MAKACGFLCLMSRTDVVNLSSERANEIEPYYDAFQDAVIDIKMVSKPNGTSIELILENLFVEETGKLLWSGIHDLVSPGAMSYIEIHNFDEDGNTIDIEKYVIDNIVIEIQKSTGQLINIIGRIAQELEFVPENEDDTQVCSKKSCPDTHKKCGCSTTPPPPPPAKCDIRSIKETEDTDGALRRTEKPKE